MFLVLAWFADAGSDHMADVGKSSVEASEKVTERGSGTGTIPSCYLWTMKIRWCN